MRSQCCREKRNRNDASLKPNQIFHHSTVIATDAQIAKHNKLVVDLETGGGLLLTSARIDGAHIQIQTIENGAALCSLSFLKDFPVKLLHEQHGGASSEHVIIAG